MMSNEEKILTAELMGLSHAVEKAAGDVYAYICLLYTSPSPRD